MTGTEPPVLADPPVAPASLAEAILAIQSDPPQIVKGETAEAGKFSYSYASLHTVTEAVRPKLAGLGCTWVCKPTRAADGVPVLTYTLRHVSSGETETGEFPLMLPPNASPQVLGSLLSYLRRYCLLAVLGLAPAGEDDDAAAASGYGARDPERTTRPRKASKAQITAIMAGYTELGFGGPENRDTRLRVSANMLGLADLETHNGITSAQARIVLDGIAERKRAQKEAGDA